MNGLQNSSQSRLNNVDKILLTEKFEQQYVAMLVDSSRREAEKRKLRKGIKTMLGVACFLFLSGLFSISVASETSGTLSVIGAVSLLVTSALQGEELKRLIAFEVLESRNEQSVSEESGSGR